MILDRQVLATLALALAATGIFQALTTFHTPELNQGMWGVHVFAVKRDAIEGYRRVLFASLAVFGLMIQWFAEVTDIQSQANSFAVYAVVLLISVVSAIALARALHSAGAAMARSSWVPQCVDHQRELFSRAQFVLENDGWYPEQQADRAEFRTPDVRARNLERVEEHIQLLERLFDVESQGALGERLHALRPYFDS